MSGLELLGPKGMMMEGGMTYGGWGQSFMLVDDGLEQGLEHIP